MTVPGGGEGTILPRLCSQLGERRPGPGAAHARSPLRAGAPPFAPAWPYSARGGGAPARGPGAQLGLESLAGSRGRERKGKEQRHQKIQRRDTWGKAGKKRPRESHTGRGKSRKDRTERRLGGSRAQKLCPVKLGASSPSVEVFIHLQAPQTPYSWDFREASSHSYVQLLTPSLASVPSLEYEGWD